MVNVKLFLLFCVLFKVCILLQQQCFQDFAIFLSLTALMWKLPTKSISSSSSSVSMLLLSQAIIVASVMISYAYIPGGGCKLSSYKAMPSYYSVLTCDKFMNIHVSHWVTDSVLVAPRARWRPSTCSSPRRLRSVNAPSHLSQSHWYSRDCRLSCGVTVVEPLI